MSKPMGRPREHDRDQIASDMIEWARLPDSINLCGFCCTREPPIAPSKITIWAKECDNFRKAYETAKCFIADRREKMLNADRLHVKAYDMNAATYDHFMRDERRSTMEFESSLRANENKATSEDDVKRFDTIMDQISSLKSERKIAVSKAKREKKS